MLASRLGNTTAPGPALPKSGVELLNTTLSDVNSRIMSVIYRIGTVANQFGAPSAEGEAGNPSKPPETTNELLSSIDRSLTDLERITSRLDNQ